MFLGVPKSLLQRLGWTTFSYGSAQLLRLVNNVILARLLAPPIFGLMAVVNAVRTGVELLSDVGIMQNIISNPKGDDPLFYDTAWTLQVMRGLTLAVFSTLLAVPIARFFHHPELATIMPVASLFFIFTGFESTSRGLIQKRLQIARASIFQIILATVTLAAHVIAALITQTVWALVFGSVATGAASLILTYLYIPGTRHRFIIDPASARQLMKFGKWVFFSSIVYFFAMNFDRLYFAKQITLSQLGVYGIARSLADMVSLFVQRCSSFVLYPTVAAARLPPIELRKRILHGRRTLLFGAAVFMGCFLALSDLIVGLLYDARYREAGMVLPILCAGVWFNILSSTNDAILMGLSRPAYPALSNSAKLLTYVVGVPMAFFLYGFTAAVAVIAIGEFVKYVTLWMLSHKEHLRFGRDDLLLTIAFVVSAFLMRELTHELGWTAAAGPIHPKALVGSIHL
jgi:O-antigen/teichoic acid export membrane protein